MQRHTPKLVTSLLCGARLDLAPHQPSRGSEVVLSSSWSSWVCVCTHSSDVPIPPPSSSAPPSAWLPRGLAYPRARTARDVSSSCDRGDCVYALPPKRRNAGWVAAACAARGSKGAPRRAARTAPYGSVRPSEPQCSFGVGPRKAHPVQRLFYIQLAGGATGPLAKCSAGCSPSC